MSTEPPPPRGQIPTWLQGLIPDQPMARRLSLQSVIFAIGEGTFITASAVFFTQIVGLRAAQVGLGLTIAGVIGFFFAVPLGKLADRVGPQRMWVLGAGGLASLYFIWPLLHGFWGFLAMSIAVQIIETGGRAGRHAYTLNLFDRANRVRSLAYMRVALNVGFTVGALFGGLALATNSDTVVLWLPIFTGALLVLNAIFIARLPAATPHHAPAEARATTPEQLITPGALRNRGFLALMTGDGVMGTNQVLLNVVIPLWLVQETDAPRVVLAWLFATNTIMAVFLQVRASRGISDVPSCLKATRLATGFMLLSCGVIYLTHDTVGWVTIALMLLGHITVTGAELYQSAAAWGFMAELAEPDKRGEYAGASSLGHSLGSVWAPAAYTWLAMEWGGPGWAVIGLIVLAAATVMHPAAYAAQRYLDRHGVTVS